MIHLIGLNQFLNQIFGLYCILCIVLKSDEISESPKVKYYSIADLNLTKMA